MPSWDRFDCDAPVHTYGTEILLLLKIPSVPSEYVVKPMHVVERFFMSLSKEIPFSFHVHNFASFSVALNNEHPCPSFAEAIYVGT